MPRPLVLPLSDLSFKEGEAQQRPPFSEGWIRDKLLAPGALDGLNKEARCILLAMVNTGARPSELAALTSDQIWLSAATPHISIEPVGRQLKTRNARRVIPLTGVSLKAMAQCPDGFPKYRVSSASLSATVNKYLRANRLLETPGHSLYGLRHSFEGWAEPPILWTMAIGAPSSNKSPGLDAVLGPLKDLERATWLNMEGEQAAWREASDLAKLAESGWKEAAKAALKEGMEPPARPESADPGPEPFAPRLSIADGTVERLAVILSRQPRGTLLARDELAGWLHGMTRYAGGGSDRPFWLEAYGGRAYPPHRSATLRTPA